jgi:hypothetical protein
MCMTKPMPYVLLVLVGFTLALIVWGFSRQRKCTFDRGTLGRQDDLLVGALLLGAFALGVFLTYGIFILDTW